MNAKMNECIQGALFCQKILSREKIAAKNPISQKGNKKLDSLFYM
jgi:hypothetical protein